MYYRFDREALNKRWEQLSGHEAAYAISPVAAVFGYDPADDGPECEVITRILAAYPNEVRVR